MKRQRNSICGNTESYINKIILSIFCGGVVYAVLIKILSKNVAMFSNIKTYILLLLVPGIVFLLSMVIPIKQIKNRELHLNKTIFAGVLLLIVFLGGSALRALLFYSTNVLGRAGEPVDQYIVPNYSQDRNILFLLAFLFCVVYVKEGQFKHFEKYFFVCLGIGEALLAGCLVYMPGHISNYAFVDFDAYWHSCYNYMYDVPLTIHNASFYGNYGLLLALYFKIFGFTVQTIYVLESLESIIVISILCYLVYKLTKNFAIRLFGFGFILEYLVTSIQVYPQGYGHRILFPAIMVFVIYQYISGNKKRVWKLLSYLTVYLNMIWSNDTGIIVWLSWCCFWFYQIISSDNCWKKK